MLPQPLRELVEQVEHRVARIPTRLNEYGYDPFGLDPEYGRELILGMCMVYRWWLRVETRGIERVPPGRVLLIANHAGNTFAWDGAMLGIAMLLEAEPPRTVRGMAEYYLPTLPFFGVFLHRMGSVLTAHQRRAIPAAHHLLRRRRHEMHRNADAPVRRQVRARTVRQAVVMQGHLSGPQGHGHGPRLVQPGNRLPARQHVVVVVGVLVRQGLAQMRPRHDLHATRFDAGIGQGEPGGDDVA
jgi:hypothetical protein